MRCTFYCIAKEIDLKKLSEIFSSDNSQFFDDVLCLQKEISHGKTIDIFCFKFGSVIFWGSSEEEEELFLKKSIDALIEEEPTKACDVIHYKIDEQIEKTYIEEEDNKVVLHKDSIFIKLSISHALAQSAKLSMLENAVSNLLLKTKPLQQELAKKGTVSLSKREIAKKIGMLFSERYSVNLHSDILDTPEFFWRKPKYEPLYLATAQFQDIEIRHTILNRRLSTIHELYSMLSNELNYIHSARMEIIIIILIACEVLLGITNHGFFEKIF
ncbi:MAG: RMD1 family protein [Rickettsiaceae bacterium]|nr:RMD1 family protein [Rickettsiaceae bacterium]